jgi:hypothetical protein
MQKLNNAPPDFPGFIREGTRFSLKAQVWCEFMYCFVWP